MCVRRCWNNRSVIDGDVCDTCDSLPGSSSFSGLFRCTDLDVIFTFRFFSFTFEFVLILIHSEHFCSWLAFFLVGSGNGSVSTVLHDSADFDTDTVTFEYVDPYLFVEGI